MARTNAAHIARAGRIRRASRYTSRLIILAARRNPPSAFPSRVRRMNGQRKPPASESGRAIDAPHTVRGAVPANHRRQYVKCQRRHPGNRQPFSLPSRPSARPALHNRILPPAAAARQALTRLAPLRPASVAPRDHGRTPLGDRHCMEYGARPQPSRKGIHHARLQTHFRRTERSA